MRRSLKLGLVCLAPVIVVASAAVASPGRSSHAARVDCHAKAVTFLFWPQGHNQIPSINFPSYPYPHMEVYKTAGGTYPVGNELAAIEFTVSGQTFGGFAKTCTSAAKRLIDSRPAKVKTQNPTVLKCRFKRNAQFDYSKSTAPIGISMTVTQPAPGIKSQLEVQANMYGTESRLRYNPKLCKAYKPPTQ